MMLRRFLFAALTALFATAAQAQSLLVSTASPAPLVPTGVLLGGNPPPGPGNIIDNAPSGRVVGTLTTVGGVCPCTYVVTSVSPDSGTFTTSGSSLVRSATGTLTAGVSENINIQTTDSNSNSYTTASPFVITVSPHGSGTFIQTLTIENDTGGTQGANFITPMFGLGFNEGDLPQSAGTDTWPSIQLADGTVLNCSFGQHRTRWPDGSAKIMGGNFCQIPVSVAGGGTTIPANVFTGGTSLTPSSRSLSDFAAGSTDLNISVVGQDNLSGTWTSDLNQGVSANGADYIWSDGPAGKCWRVRAAFRQSSANHGQLEGWWYACALQDSLGNLAGVRYMPMITQPYYNTAASAYRSFASVQILNGASLISDLWSAYGTGRTFTWDGADFTGSVSGTLLTVTAVADGTIKINYTLLGSGIAAGVKIASQASGATGGIGTYNLSKSTTGTPTSAGTMNLLSTANGFQSGWLLKLTTTGTLPCGLSSGTYFAVATNTTGINAFGLNTNASSAANVVNGAVPITCAGSGTQTATPFPYQSQWGSSPLANIDGTYRFQQGGGSFTADSVVRVIQNPTYVRHSGLIPPYAFGLILVNSNVSCDYYLNTACFVNRSFGTTGERPDLGPETSWAVRYWFNHAPVDERVLRVTSLVGQTLPLNLIDSTTKSIPVVNNGIYSGMPTANPNLFWYASTSSVGISKPTTPLVLEAGFNEISDGHMPDWAYAAYLVTGEPQDHDWIARMGNSAIYTRSATFGTASAALNGPTTIGGERNGSINGSNYYGWRWKSGDLTREDAWGTRDVGAACAAVTDAENASYPSYFCDLDHVQYDAGDAYISMLAACCSFANTNGIWAENNTSYGGVLRDWSNGYLDNTIAMDYARNEYSGALTFGNWIAKYKKYEHDTFGTLFLANYNAIVRQATNTSQAPYITSSTGIAFGSGLALSWTSSSPTFTMTATGGYHPYVPTNNDKVMFNEQAKELPVGFAGETPYYEINATSTTFQLSATIGGSAITPTSTGKMDGEGDLIVPVSYSGNLIGSSGQIGYGDNVYGSLCNMTSAGMTVESSAETDLWAYITAQSIYPSYYVTNPKYLMQCTR